LSPKNKDLSLKKKVEKKNRVDRTFNAIRAKKRVKNSKKKIFKYNIQNCKDKKEVLWYREKLAILTAMITDMI
jgi:hypothetical protein